MAFWYWLSYWWCQYFGIAHGYPLLWCIDRSWKLFFETLLQTSCHESLLVLCSEFEHPLKEFNSWKKMFRFTRIWKLRYVHLSKVLVQSFSFPFSLFFSHHYSCFLHEFATFYGRLLTFLIFRFMVFIIFSMLLWVLWMLMTVFLNVRLINNEEACEEVMESLWMEWLPGPTIVILSEPDELIASNDCCCLKERVAW